MANQRAKDQKLLPFAAKRQFVLELDAGLKEIGCGNRSQFIRDAILEKLAKENIHIPKALAASPARTSETPYQLNEAANSKKIDAAVAAGGKKISYMVRKNRKPPRV